MSCVFISLYFTTLVSFSFVSHPVSYCLLLLFGAISASGFLYCVMGFSWYLVLFCLVYVGGVYVLFIYISIFSSKASLGLSGGWFLSFFCLSSFLFFFFSLKSFFVSFSEQSHYLCSFYEGFTYCIFCLVLMVSFVLVSVVGSDKGSFFR